MIHIKYRELLIGGCVAAAMAISSVPAVAASVCECVPGKPTAASYTWNFKGEANSLFHQIQEDAQDAQYHADHLDSLARNVDIHWQTHLSQLAFVKNDINDMGAKLCRLEVIRSAVAPWQKTEIDRIATDVRLMADNAQDAILYVDHNQGKLWMPPYRQYDNNLYKEARSLSHSVNEAVAYAGVSHEYRGLRKDLGVRTGS
jgi:hypothetical protein